MVVEKELLIGNDLAALGQASRKLFLINRTSFNLNSKIQSSYLTADSTMTNHM